MSDDYISREAAIRVIDELYIKRPLDSDRFVLTGVGARLEELPAADVRPVVRGKWVMSDMQEGWVTCSVCKKMKFDGRMAFSPTLFVEWGLNFCPHCGADMREEQND